MEAAKPMVNEIKVVKSGENHDCEYLQVRLIMFRTADKKLNTVDVLINTVEIYINIVGVLINIDGVLVIVLSKGKYKLG